ncbi:filamentous hemagglutinin N-terminal domain-containing protein, partial [Azospirillum isscasi]
MGKGNVTNTPGITEIPGARRHRQTLRQRLLLSSAAEAPQRGGGGTRRQRRAAKARGGIDFARLALRSVIGVALSTLFAGAAYANPLEGTVTAGAATIQSATPKSMEILQSTDKAIINWKSFSIDAGEKVTFQQPSASSVTLNRVTGTDTSKIMGSLSANGTVMLVNPNGVVIGAGAKVDVGGLVATTANISDANFMAGKYQFDQASAKPNAMVVNEGDITVKDSGLAALVAPHVRNSGVIRAKLGKVALGGAETFTLDFHGDGLISFDASSAVKTVAKDADGKPVAALVVNSGEIAAEGGSVTLSARAVKGVIDNVINTDGVIKATSVGSANGKIVLSGGDNGTVAIGGTVDASGRGDGQTGGTVVATGAEIAVKRNARVDASGSKGGGEVAIGSRTGRSGTWSDKVTVEAGATLSADAVKSGKGGSVTVLSQKSTRHAGKISARGGAEGGDGGFAEVSSHKDITLTGSVDLTAPKGAAGVFLLDPESLRIVGSTGGSQDGAATDGTIGVNDPNLGGGGNVNTVSKGVLESIAGNANIVLEASGQITVETSLDLQTTAGHGFTLRSLTSGGIAFNDASHEIRTNGGDIVLEANGLSSSLSSIGKLTTRGGSVRLSATGGVQLANLIDTTPTTGAAGAVSVRALGGSITAAGAAKIVGGAVALTAGIDIGASGAAISTSSSRLSLVTGGSLFVANDRTLTDLSVTSTHGAAGGNSQFGLTSTGLSFAVTDAAGGYTLDTVTQAGGLTSFSFSGDRSIQVGTVNAGPGAVALTSTAGDITGGGTGLLTGGTLTLAARGSSGTNGAIGTASQALNTTVTSLTAASGSGGVFVSNTGALALTGLTTGGGATVSATGSLTVGAVRSGGALTLTSGGGSILNDADPATTINASSLSLNAAGSIGTSGAALTTGATSINAASGAGGVFLTASGSAALGSIVSTSGDIAIATGGTTTIGEITSANGTSNITVTANGVSSAITASTVNAGANGNVTLTTANGDVTASSGPGITGNNVTIAAGGASSTVTVKTAAKTLTVSNGTGIVGITQTGAVTLDSIVSSGSAVSVTVGGGDVTVGTVKAASFGLISLTASDGAIKGKDASNLLSAGAVTLGAGGAIGTAATHVRTATPVLALTGVGDLYVDNVGTILTSLTIDNRHAGTTANTLQLTSDYFNFTASDNGTTTVLEALGSPKLSTLKVTSDATLVVGDLATVGIGGTVTLTSTAGSILDDGNTNTRLNADTVTLSAATGNLGSAAAPLALNATKLTLTTRGDLHLTNLSDVAALSITSAHTDATVVNSYSITAPNLAFSLTDDATNGYLLSTLVDTTGLIFAFKGDRDIRLGRVDLTDAPGILPPTGPASGTAYSVARFETTNGSILDDGSKTTAVLAGAVSLTASKAIGSGTGTEHLDVITPVLDAKASDGGIYVTLPTSVGIANQKNLVTLGGSVFSAGSNPIVVTATWSDIAFGSNFTSSGTGNITVTATHGSILNPSSATLRSGSSGTLTLTAGKDIGSSTNALSASAGTVTATAGGSVWLSLGSGATTLNSLTAGGDITVGKSSGTMTVGSVNANGGTGTVTLSNTSGSIQGDSDSTTVIAAGKVILSATGSVGGTSALNLTTANLSITAGGSIGITDTVALTDLSLTRGSYSGGSIAISTVTGQVFTLSDSSSQSYVQTVTSTAPLNFTFEAPREVKVGTVNVGAGGRVAITSSGSIVNNGSGGKITAGTVSLTAGTSNSIGASGTGNAISLDTADLTVTAGRNIHVNNNGRALSSLAVVSTNSTTTSTDKSIFAIAGTGTQTYTLSDSGTVNSIDVTGANNSNFSFTGKKHISVSEIVTTGGTVSLATAGGGVNSTITLSGGGTILASAVTLSANGSGTGGGSIGSSERAMKLAASSLTVVSNGDIYINNSNTALTSLDVTITHKSGSDGGTYQFNALGANRSFTVSESSGVQTLTLGTPSSGTNPWMNLRYSVDRAILVGSMDAGTSTTGSVTLISSGAATASSPSINGSGTITAGQVSLTATGTNSNVGGSTAVQTSTTKLAITSGGNVSVNNSATLTELTLDSRHSKSATDNANTYSIVSNGLTASFSDSKDTGLTVTNVTQSGLKLKISNDKQMRITKIDVGSTGTVDLAAGTNAINATTTGTAVVVADSLTLTASSVGNTRDGDYRFYSQVNTLTTKLTGSLKLGNSGTLTLKDVSAGSSADIQVTNSGSLLQSGTAPLRADSVTLKVEGGSIGASGTPLLTETQTLDVTAGRNVRLTNSADLFALTLDAKHGSTGTQNVYDIRSEGLSFALTDNGSGSLYTLSNVVDQSGIDFSFKSDVGVVLGTVKAGEGRRLTVETTGTGKNISSNGSSLLTAGTVTLTSTGAIGAAGASANHIVTMADRLVLSTATDAFVDNNRDLAALSLTSNRTTGAGSYQITAPELTFTVTDDGTTTTVSELTDVTGLNLKLDTKHALSIGTLNVQSWGIADLTSGAGILGAASATAGNPANRITAGTATLTAKEGAIGSSGNKIHLSASSAAFNVTGDLYVESDTRIGTLALKSTSSTVSNRTYSLTSANPSGGAVALIGAASGTQTLLATLTDGSGLRFSAESHNKIVVGGLDVGKTGMISLTASQGIVGTGAPNLKINAGVATLTASSGVVGANGGEFINITTGNLKVSANNGAVITLHGSTVIDSMTLGGPLFLTNSTGDIALGAIDLGNANATISNQGGSILSGTLSNANLVTLEASGSIGNVTAIATSAGTGGTTTVSATAAGSIAVSEAKSLTAQSVVSSGGGAITLSTGTNATGNLTAGTVTTTGAVSLTSGNGNILAGSGNLVTGASVLLSAVKGSIADTGSTLNVATTDLTLKTPGAFKVADTLDLAKLSIDRTPSTGTSTSGTMSLTAANLSWNVTDSSGTTTFTTLTDSTGLDFTFKAPGAIAVGTVNTGAASTVSLTATGNGTTAGNITALNGSSTITAESLTLDAQKKTNEQTSSSAIGSNGTALGLNVSNLSATSGSGGLFVKNAGALNLGSISTGGALTATATTGDLTIGSLSYDTAKALTLTATAGRIVSGGTASLTIGNGNATLTAGAGIGTAQSGLKVSASGTGSLTTNVTGTGGVHLDVSGQLTGGLNATVANGPVVVSSSGNITLSNVSIVTDAEGNSISVTATGGSITAGTVAAGAANGTVTLSATGIGGKILAATGGSEITGKTVLLNGAGGIGTSSARVGVGGAQVQVSGGSGDIHLGTSGATTLAYAATTGGKIDVLAGDRLQVVSAGTGGGAITIASTAADADIVVGSINAGTGAVTVSSTGGAIREDGVPETRIVGGSVSLTGAKGVGTATAAMQTTTGSLALSSSAGSIHVTDATSNGVTVTSASASGGSVTIASAGTMTVQSVSASTTNGTVALTAAGSILGSGGGTHVTGHSASLTATGGDIGTVTNAATGAGTPLKMNVSNLTGLTATGATPVISVDNVNTAALTLGNNLVTLGTGGSAYIRTAGNLDASAGLSMSSGNLLLQSGGTLTLPTAAINLGAGALMLKGTTDVVAAGASPRSLTITAASLIFASGSSGGDTTLNTTVGTIDASLTGSGKNLTVSNTGTLTAATLSASGTVTATSSTGMTATSVTGVGTVSLTATAGDLTVGTVNAGASGVINLSAAGGSLLTGNGTSLTGGTLNLTSGTGIGTSANAFTSSIANISATVTGTGGIHLAGTSFALGNLSTANGDIAVTATGAITDGNATTGITAGGSGAIALTSTGGAVTLTKAVSSTGPDGTRASVTVQGTSIGVANVTTTGTQTYTGNTTLSGALSGKAVTVTGTLTLAGANRTVTATGGDLSVTGTLNGGGFGATLSAAQGGVTLGGAASNLSSLSVTANTIGLHDVTTAGAQTYTGAASLQGTYATGNGAFSVTGATSLAGDATVSAGSGAVTFAGTVNGARALTVNSSGATTFTGAVGGTAALTSLTTDTGGTSSLKSVATTGAQSYGDSVTLDGTYATGNGAFGVAGTTTLSGTTTVNAGSGAITFTGAVNGAQALTVNGSGATTFTAAVGGTTALASLTTDAGGTTSLRNVTTTGIQTYNDAVTLNGTYSTGSGAFTANGAVTLGGDTTVNGGAATFTGAVDGAYALAVNNKGATQFTGAVGGTAALASLTTDAGGTTSLRNVTTTGAQTYNDA